MISICPKHYWSYTIELCQKKVVEKFSFSELKIDKGKIFYSESNQNFLH